VGPGETSWSPWPPLAICFGVKWHKNRFHEKSEILLENGISPKVVKSHFMALKVSAATKNKSI
jgi:hypothetical protein